MTLVHKTEIIKRHKDLIITVKNAKYDLFSLMFTHVCLCLIEARLPPQFSQRL